MAYDLATVTNSGNQLLASVVSDKSSLVIDKIEVSGTQIASSTDLKSMTSISNVVQTLSANGYQKKDSSFIISTVLDNSSVTADYQAWVFGIWAHETSGGSPILMSVITSTNSPDTITKGAGTPVDYNYKFVTTFSNTSSLTIQMSSDTYATNDAVLHNSGDETATGTKTFQEIKISNDKFPSLVQTDGQYITLDGGNSELIPANDSKVVHTTGDETVDGKKAFKVDPVDGAGNAYAKTLDVNQQLDKKVNTADMRKPASDVAGIEEVNAKQDKIGYTPADDSKVVHDNHDNTITANNVKYDLSKTGLTPLGLVNSGSFNDLPLGTVYAPSWLTDGPNSHNSFVTTTFFFSDWGGLKTQIAIANSTNLMYFRVYTGSNWASWVLLSDNSQVAHLSGANNFDTVPTVNNNPLLLASSLPSDLARTGSDQEFTGKNTFDTAPIDKTTGNPYITKDGVPSDVARTGQAQTFTAAQTFSIAPVINDASTSKGDNQAATMADLKSVEADAWHVAESSYPGLLMQVDRDDKIIYILSTGNPNTTRSLDYSNTICDLSSYIDQIVSASGYITVEDTNTNVGDQYSLGFTGAKLLVNANGHIILGGGGYTISGDPNVLNNTSAFLKLKYNSWIGK